MPLKVDSICLRGGNAMIPCPACGQPTTAEAAACTNCGHATTNGTGPQPKKPTDKPVPPPEVSGWVLYPTPPEIIEEMRRTFNEEEFFTQLREAEKAGLPELKDLIRDLEQEMAPRD
jgi:hypothetical protein